MRYTQLIALRYLINDGRAVYKGDVFYAPEWRAAKLITRRWAIVGPEVPGPIETPVVGPSEFQVVEPDEIKAELKPAVEDAKSGKRRRGSRGTRA